MPPTKFFPKFIILALTYFIYAIWLLIFGIPLLLEGERGMITKIAEILVKKGISCMTIPDKIVHLRFSDYRGDV